MDIRNLFILADESLNDVVQQITDKQWDRSMPEDFPTGDKHTYTLRDIMNYHAYDEAWVPAMLSGKTMEEVGKETFGKPFGGDLLGENPKENYAALSEKAIAAAREFPEDELDNRTVHFSYGDYPAREALRHITSFRGLRVYDLSKAIGFDTRMPDELVKGLWEMIEPRIDEWRQMGVFPPEVEVPEDTPLQTRLLGMTGRRE